ncbi:MAG: RDD family protein [Saprospiraceae bacterium]|nr:RDD family protein [Saprospiraceae bacterium]HMS66606.1 RDD family protein [Saprospiraceae bacterium]
MSTIQFKTAQNIKVEYALAGMWERVGAYAIDLTVLFFSYLLLNLILNFVVGPNFSQLICVTLVFTSLLMQEIILNGRTLGKFLLGLKVVKISGKEPQVFDYLIRWVFRTIEILFSLGILAMAAVSTSNLRQRLGDVVANTVVIKVSKSREIDLEGFLRRDDKEFTIKYPQAAMLNEQSALALKYAVLRFEKYPNPNNLLLRKDLVNQLKNDLKIAEVIKDENKFIRNIIADYILSTR